jgi:cobalamin biosynthesis protein CobD/CbiB
MALTPDLSVDVAHIIQLAVAPVFLLSGVGVTLTLFTNRLARIVDRARILEDRLRENPHVDLHEALAVLAKRARYINYSMALGTISGLLVTTTVILLFTTALLGNNMTVLIAAVFSAAMLTLTASLLVFFVEVRYATRNLRIGMLPRADNR